MDNKTIGYVILEGETSPVDHEVVIRKESGNRVIAEAILQEAEEENRNGRTYLASDISREISCDRTIELIEAGYMRGESGHPISNDIVRQQTIDPNNVCVKYLKMWMEGNFVKCLFKGTNNEKGEYVDRDLRDGDKPAFSLRALGTLANVRGRNVVQDLRMITYDHVIFPSHSKAYTTHLVNESAIIESATEYNTNSSKGALIPVYNQQVIDFIKNESANLKSVLNQIDCFYESVKLVNNSTKVQLRTKAGDLFMINLENYIQNEIMNYGANLI